MEVLTACSYWIDLGFSFLEPSSIAWRFPIGMNPTHNVLVPAWPTD